MGNEKLDASDGEDATGTNDTIDLWELLWTLEHEAASLNAAAGELIRHEELFGDEASSRRHRRRAADWRVTYERPLADWRELYDDHDAPTAADNDVEPRVEAGAPPESPATAEVVESVEAVESEELRRPRAGSFASQIKADAPGPGATGVTGSFRNAVYGIDTAAPAARLRDLLQERSFEKLWVEGTSIDGDRFAEFFAAEGFGRVRPD